MNSFYNNHNISDDPRVVLALHLVCDNQDDRGWVQSSGSYYRGSVTVLLHLSKEILVQGEFCPWKLLPVISLLKL